MVVFLHMVVFFKPVGGSFPGKIHLPLPNNPIPWFFIGVFLFLKTIQKERDLAHQLVSKTVLICSSRSVVLLCHMLSESLQLADNLAVVDVMIVLFELSLPLCLFLSGPAVSSIHWPSRGRPHIKIVQRIKQRIQELLSVARVVLICFSVSWSSQPPLPPHQEPMPLNPTTRSTVPKPGPPEMVTTAISLSNEQTSDSRVRMTSHNLSLWYSLSNQVTRELTLSNYVSTWVVCQTKCQLLSD